MERVVNTQSESAICSLGFTQLDHSQSHKKVQKKSFYQILENDGSKFQEKTRINSRKYRSRIDSTNKKSKENQLIYSQF